VEQCAREPLSQTLDRAFMQDLGNGAWRFYGNFQTVAYGFEFRSNGRTVIDLLKAGTLASRKMPGFRSQPSTKRRMEAIRKWRLGTQA